LIGDVRRYGISFLSDKRSFDEYDGETSGKMPVYGIKGR
jgi:hypothetical protein